MKSLLIFIGTIGVLYTGMCILLYLSQDGLIFLKTQSQKTLQSSLISPFNLKTENIELAGYKKVGGSENTVLYFGGNAEDITGIFERNIFSGNVIALNYRGYGKSDGEPSEQALFHDALFLYDSLLSHGTILPDRTILVGRSLGTGIATYLASQRKIGKLVLITPYDSMESLAKENYPYFPISFLLKHKFLSTQYISSYTGNTLILVAENDTVIPYKHTANLIKYISTNKTVKLIPGATHNNILMDSGALNILNTYIYETPPHSEGTQKNWELR